MYICFLSCKFIFLKWYICNSVVRCHYPLEVAFIWLILMITFPSSNHCIYISLGWLCWKESSLVSVHCLRRLQKCHYLWLLSYIISSGSSSCCLTHILYLTNFPVDLMPCFTFFLHSTGLSIQTLRSVSLMFDSEECGNVAYILM